MILDHVLLVSEGGLMSESVQTTFCWFQVGLMSESVQQKQPSRYKDHFLLVPEVILLTNYNKNNQVNIYYCIITLYSVFDVTVHEKNSKRERK